LSTYFYGLRYFTPHTKMVEAASEILNAGWDDRINYVSLMFPFYADLLSDRINNLVLKAIILHRQSDVWAHERAMN